LFIVVGNIGMARQLTLQQRIFIVKQWIKHDRNSRAVAAAFAKEYPNDAPPSRQSMHVLAKKFHETGSVTDKKRSGRPNNMNTDENKENVRTFYQNAPSTSAVRASLQLHIPRTSLRRIMKDIELKVWRPRLLHQMNDDDYDRRIEFCEWLQQQLHENIDIRDRIIWTDEASFKLNGHVNLHNAVYYSTENPHLVWETNNLSPGICVWGGIRSTGVLGPYFFDGTVNSQLYLDMLRDFAVPQLDTDNDVWMQDGAPPHYGRNVRDFLDNTFEMWIGRRGTTEWPPRSPDLTPCDYSMWGILKERVYSQNVLTISELKERITTEFAALNNDKDLCRRICHSVQRRIQLCIKSEGQHFEDKI